MLKDGSKQAIIGYGKMMSLDCLILTMTNNNQISCWNWIKNWWKIGGLKLYFEYLGFWYESKFN